MANVLHRLASSRNLSLVYPTREAVINWDDVEEVVPPAHQYDMICNHQMVNLTITRAYLKPSPFVFTLVRDPVAMADSRFRYKSIRGSWEESPPIWEHRLATMAEERTFWLNPIARDLGWYKGVDIRREPEVPQNFSRDQDPEAVANFAADLDEALDLALLTEQYDEGLVLLKHRLGLTMDDIVYLRMKANPVTAQDIPPPTVAELERLDEYISVDKVLYKALSERFWRDWEAAGGQAALGAEVQELRARNEALLAACLRLDSVACPPWMAWDNDVFSLVLQARPDVPDPQHRPPRQ